MLTNCQRLMQGAWIEHMGRAHDQANIWHHDMVLNLTCLDPLTWGWRYLDQKLVAVLFQVAPAICLSAAARQVQL